MHRALLAIVAIYLVSLTGLTIACEKLHINGGENWYPHFYRGLQGEKGIIGDAVNEAGIRAGISLKFDRPAPWKRLLHELDKGKLDVLAGVLKTHQREKIFAFSRPISQLELRIFAPSSQPFPFYDVSDLSSKRGVKLLGMSLGEKLDAYAFDHLVIDKVNSASSLFKMVAINRVDYGISFKDFGLKQIEALGLSNNIVMLDTPLSTVNLHVAFSKTSDCQPQIKALKLEIDRMTNDGSTLQIQAKYLSTPYSNTRGER